MEEKKAEFRGCGSPATRICFRGKGRSRFVCDECPTMSSGGVKAYETDVAGQEKKPGVYSGPSRVCGDEVGG